MSNYLSAVQSFAGAPGRLIDGIAGKVDRALGYKSSTPSYFGRTIAVASLGAATVGVYYAARKLLSEIAIFKERFDFFTKPCRCVVENLDDCEELKELRYEICDMTTLANTTRRDALLWIKNANLTRVNLFAYCPGEQPGVYHMLLKN